jgi:hypothetical protein
MHQAVADLPVGVDSMFSTDFAGADLSVPAYIHMPGTYRVCVPDARRLSEHCRVPVYWILRSVWGI